MSDHHHNIVPTDDNALFELSLNRFLLFRSQDVENGYFDVTFEFEIKTNPDNTEDDCDEEEDYQRTSLKVIHAHSFILWSASEPLKAMIVGAFAKTKKPIPITSHSYEDFFNFLVFLYLGQCKIKIDNVMTMVDMAEFYDVPLLKQKCDAFLIHTQPTLDTVFKIYESLKLYSLENALEAISKFIMLNASSLIKSKEFLTLKKDTITSIVRMENLCVKEEELFEAVYEWALKQRPAPKRKSPYKKQEDARNYMHTVVKANLNEILPFIRFPIMSLNFLHMEVVPKGYIFSSLDELGTLLNDATKFAIEGSSAPCASQYSNKRRGGCRIHFTDKNNNQAFAFTDDEQIIQKLSKQMGYQTWSNSHSNFIGCYWNINLPSVLKPSNIIPDKNSKMYVIKDINERFGIKYLPEKQRTDLHYGSNNNNLKKDNEMIIAKVFPEDDEKFSISNGCQFSISLY